MKFYRHNDPQRKDGLALKIRLTNRCNYKCHYCFYRDNSSPVADVKRILDFFLRLENKYPYFYIYLHGGEPTIHPDFIWFIEHFTKLFKNIDYFLYFDTNFTQPMSFWDRFYEKIDPEKVKVNCTLHPNQCYSIDNFFQRFRNLKTIKQLNIMVESKTFNRCMDIFNSCDPDWNVVPKPIFFDGDELKYTKQQRQFFYNHDKTREFCYVSTNNIKVYTLNQIELENLNNFYMYRCEYGQRNIVIDVNGDMYYCVAHQLSNGNPFMNLYQDDLNKYFEVHKPNICIFKKCSACDLRILKEKI